MSNTIYIDKCKKKCDVITFSENKMSTKMLKAMMLKMGNGKISYHNSRTKSTHTTIMSLNYIENRLLLFRYKYKLYYHYVKTLSNINKDTYAKILQMLDTLISQLSTEERNIVFNTPPPEPPIPETFEDSGIVFKVVTKRIANFSYFIIINIKNNYIFETGLFYTFDLSDPTNLGTAFCLSLNKDSVAYDCRYHLTSGEPGSNMKVYISKGIPYTQLYIFNKDDPAEGARYQKWGYSYEYLFINRDKLNIDDITTFTFKTFDTSYLKFIVYEWYGPKIMIDPYISSDPTKFSNNNVYLYKNTYKYQLGIGVYYIYLHNYYSLAFLNRNKSTVGVSSQYNRGTKTLNQLFLAGSGLDGDYTFHSGLIRLTILDSFEPITIYNDKYGYMGSLFMIQYNKTSLKTAMPDDYIYTSVGSRYGLDSQTFVDPVTFTFQKIPYLADNRFAMAEGVYTIYNTSDIPITLLNQSKQDWISIESISTKIVNKVTVQDIILGIGPNGEECTFYYGTIRIRVRGDFGECSLYRPRKGLSDGGYRGGYGLLVYDAAFSNQKSYDDQDMTSPTIIPNTSICTVQLEPVPKPISVTTLTSSEYIMNIGGLFQGTQKIGDMGIYDMRFKLEIREYTFILSGSVTIYRTDALKNTRSIGISSIKNLIYPVYNTTFYVESTSTEDFHIIYTQGTTTYTYFMTYQN